MTPFRYHVFACDQTKPEGMPCCAAAGSAAVIDALRREVASRRLLDQVLVTACGSIGQCENGPNLVVYPDGVWYSHVSPADVPEIVREHFEHGRPVERLARRDEAALKVEITANRGKAAAAMAAREALGVIPDTLADTIRGFMPSRVLLTALELDVFTAVARALGAATASSVAAALKTDTRATEVVLNALVALGMVVKQDGNFCNGPVASRFLVEGAKDDARAALRHNLSLWNTWSNLTEVTRTGAPVRHDDMAVRSDAWTTPFIAAMHRNAAVRAPLVVQAVGATGVKRLLDIGGGSGAYSIAFAQAAPGLEAEVLDLSTVVGIAARHVADAGLSDRIRTRVGDLRHDPFGAGYDLALLCAICHMLGPEENGDLFRRVFAALAPGGRLVIQDFVMADDKTAPRAGALFAVNMLVGTQSGSSYSQTEYTRWLEDAGFIDVRCIRMPGPSDLLVARRP